MPKKAKAEERYEITFKGLVTLACDMDGKLANKICDAVELYLRRNYQTETECGAIIFDGKQFIMTSVQKGGN